MTDNNLKDNGTMPKNVSEFSNTVIGHKIASVKRTLKKDSYIGKQEVTVFTLDDGSQVELINTNDCCAFTKLENIVEKLPFMDHIITDVVSSDGYSKWHIIADFGEVLELQIKWSAGNPFYYNYGFNIKVKPVEN